MIAPNASGAPIDHSRPLRGASLCLPASRSLLCAAVLIAAGLVAQPRLLGAGFDGPRWCSWQQAQTGHSAAARRWGRAGMSNDADPPW